MIACYIIYPPSINKFYVGFTHENIEHRLKMHITSGYGNHFTSNTNVWELFYYLPCDSIAQEMKIEKHIKAMKSRRYFFDLKKYPELAKKLQDKYKST